MSVPIKNPCFVAGTPRSSGDVQTGEVTWTRGGGRVVSQLSGIGADTLLFSGAGRLNTIVVINGASTSGAQLIFYDGVVATSGGPFNTSGHKVIGSVPLPLSSMAGSGTFVPNSLPGSIFQLDMPFQSGLIAATTKSGSVGFSVSVTPEIIDTK